MYIERFKKLAHMTMRYQSKIYRVGQQAGGSRKSFSHAQRQSAGRIPSWRRSVFVLFRPSTDGMRPTHIMESNMLYSKSSDFNVNLI